MWYSNHWKTVLLKNAVEWMLGDDGEYSPCKPQKVHKHERAICSYAESASYYAVQSATNMVAKKPKIRTRYEKQKHLLYQCNPYLSRELLS